MIVRQVVPRVAVGAVVFADCAPLSFAEIRAPQIPVTGLPQAVVEPAETVDPLSFGARHQGIEVRGYQGLSSEARLRQ